MQTTPADQEDRLALLAQPEWNKLLRHFELSYGYALIVLLARDTNLAQICFDELDLWLKTRGRPSLHPVMAQSPAELERLPDTLLALNPPPGPVWAQAVGTRESLGAAWEHCATRFNLSRDGVAAHFTSPLILVGAPWVRERLRDVAPDFWSVRAFVADLAAPRSLSLAAARELGDVRGEASEEPEVSPDPDLALAQAARLRGVPGQEGQLSYFLDRAAEGLMQRGRGEEAMGVLGEGIVVMEGLVGQEPHRADLLRDLSVFYDKMGDLQRALGNGDPAQQFFTKALDIRERLVRQEPNRADFLRDLSVSYERMGDLQAALGNGDPAKQFFTKALDIRERLVRQEPNRADFLRDLSVSFERMGDLQAALGNGDQAQQCFAKALDIRERLVRQEPNRADFLRDLSISYNKMGDFQRARGNGDQAQQFIAKALDIRERLVRQEPNRADFLRDLSVSYIKMGDLQAALRNGDQAQQFIAKALEIRERLVRQEPNRADYQTDLVVSLSRINTTEATQRALDILRRLQSEGKLTPRQLAWVPAFEAKLSGESHASPSL